MSEKYVVRLKNAAIYHADNPFGSTSAEKLMRRGEMVLSDVNLCVAPGEFVYLIGRVGSGKSTLAELLTGIYPDAALFHADDYFLRPEQRTEARYAQPGGNLDRERLETEILIPLSRGENPEYRPFDCRAMSLAAPQHGQVARLNIVEGSYSLHPELERCYDLSVFLEISPETQRRRVLERNGPEWGQRFFERWIPLENTYHEATRTAERCTLRLEEEP